MSNTNIGVFLTDTHLFEKYTKKESKLENNFEEVYGCFKQAIEIAKGNGLNRVFFGGDFFDSRKHQSQNLIKKASEIFNLFSSEQVWLSIIVGNHDKTDYDSSFSFLSVFKYHPYIHLVEDFDFLDDGENKVRYHLLSYFNNEKYLTLLQKCQSNIIAGYKNILLTHIGIHGVIKNSGDKDETSIKFKDFEGFDKVLIGHYHNQSSYSNNRFTYFGSAIQHNFGEDSNKGIVVLNNKLHLNRIKTNFREYVNHIINVSDVRQEDFDDLVNQQNDCFQKITLTGDINLIKSIDKTKLRESGIVVEHKADNFSIKDIEQKIEKHDNKSIEESFNAFCSQNEYSFNDGWKYLNKVINV